MIISFIIFELGGNLSLIESARQWVLQNLPVDRSDAALVAHLNGLDTRELLIVYNNWMSRLVKPQPRRVHKSKVFDLNPLTTQRAADLAQILDDIEKGRDLRKYLSRGVKSAAGIPGKALSRRHDLDLMLNAQGVHHLHISTQVEGDGYVKRDGPLLFVVFKPCHAYWIDIMGHGDWTSDHVLKVLAEEWPDKGVVHEMKSGGSIEVEGLRRNYTEEERTLLQKNGINTLVQFGGNVLMPGGGMTTAGTALNATRAVIHVIEQIAVFERRYATNHKRMRKLFEKSGHSFPSGTPIYEFTIQPEGVGVMETTTQIFVPFKNLDLAE